MAPMADVPRHRTGSTHHRRIQNAAGPMVSMPSQSAVQDSERISVRPIDPDRRRTRSDSGRATTGRCAIATSRGIPGPATLTIGQIRREERNQARHPQASLSNLSSSGVLQLRRDSEATREEPHRTAHAQRVGQMALIR